VKTNVMKRAMALVLAALIVLGTLGYLFSTMAYAKEGEAQTVGNYKVVYEITNDVNTIKVGDQVSFVLTLTPESGATSLDNANSVNVDSNNSGFVESNTAAKPTIDKSGSNYIVKLNQLSYQNADSRKGKLVFEVKENDKKLESFTVEISECSEDQTDPGGDDDTPGGGTGVTTSAKMTATVVGVYTNGGKTTKYISGSSQYTNADIGSQNSRKNTYMADFRVVVEDPDANPADIAYKTGVLSDEDVKINVNLISGSFRYSDLSFQDEYKPLVQSVEAMSGGGARYTILLRRVNYLASGNTLELNIIGKEDKNNPSHLLTGYTTRVTDIIDQCIPYVDKNNNNDDNTDYGSMAMATPYVIVSNYSYGGVVTAGQTFPLTLTFYNTSKNIDVQNMMITLSMPDALMLTSSSNTFYVDTLGTEDTVTKTVQVTAKANADPSSHNVEVSMKYQYIDDHTVSRKDNSTQETISIPVVQVDRFEVTGVEVSPEINLGEESDITVNYVNKGRSEVYNLSVEISGDIQNPGQQQNLGNLNSGATGSADFYIMPNAAGVCTGEIKITYEDTNMEEKTVTMTWSTNVVDPTAGMDMGGMMPGMGGVDDPSLTPVEEEKSPWPFVAGGVIVAAVVVGLLVRRRILKKRSEEEDANL
jgi:hypothetical protein